MFSVAASTQQAADWSFLGLSMYEYHVTFMYVCNILNIYNDTEPT